MSKSSSEWNQLGREFADRPKSKAEWEQIGRKLRPVRQGDPGLGDPRLLPWGHPDAPPLGFVFDDEDVSHE